MINHVNELAVRTGNHLGKGVKKSRFRTPTKNKVKNRILMAVLYGTNTKISELAEQIGVTPRAATAWIYERNPSVANQEKIAEVLNFPKEVLFYQHSGQEKIEIPFESVVHQGFLGDMIKNVILAGLMIVHNINHPDLAEYLGYSRALFRSHLHEGRIPPDEIQDQVCRFFKIPPHILYNQDLFGEVNFSAKDFRPYFRHGIRKSRK